jgi:GDP-D-mannose dehydratase
MADELFLKAIKDSREASAKLSTTKVGEVDVWRDVGGVAEEEKQGIRLLAHTKPIEYASLKTNAMKKVREATESSYKSAFEQYVAAGYPIEEAKKHALSTAKQTKSLQKKAMELLYNDESDIISAKRLVKTADAFKGMV